ncbi:ArsB/NhaD family transporter [uncultured Phascolarctobacterium sp.]|uniref:ArsB/NhaD family transporter n=1 Tax=uncultured Phascolarctobacterium sp. TaxID=512296 RepID=UPI0025E33C5D|nr:ArsB/NhaD family transporter [uncultured Phascolarctobacterium sp.]
MNQMLLVVIVFIAVYILIISERIHRTVIALTGAVILLILGVFGQSQALSYVDFNTLGLLIGMMIIVNITGRTGLFNYMAVYAAKKVHAQPVKLFFVLSCLTMVSSAFLDNVTSVLLIVPIIFSLTSQLQIDVKPFLIAQILASNIGGTATLIGDPPNIMIGSAAGFDFMDFIINVAPVSIIVFIINMAILFLLYRKKLHTTAQLQERVMRLNEKKEIVDAVLLKKCLFCLTLVIILFTTHSLLHMETATAALLGASVMLLLTCSNDEEILTDIFSRVEWLSIFFFIGLFILVGGLVETGVIKIMAQEAMALTHGDVKGSALLVLWLSAIASACIDNIPFVATLLPLIQELGAMGIKDLNPIYWALSLGACLGGCGTLVGSSANVVVASMSAQRGMNISFLKYFYIAFPLMLLSIAISHCYILYLYF